MKNIFVLMIMLLSSNAFAKTVVCGIRVDEVRTVSKGIALDKFTWELLAYEGAQILSNKHGCDSGNPSRPVALVYRLDGKVIADQFSQ